MKMEVIIPPAVVEALWSYDPEALDLEKDKHLIIRQVLNEGTEEAIEWMRRIYGVEDIKEVIRMTSRGAWKKKSLALWELIYGISPERVTRF